MFCFACLADVFVFVVGLPVVDDSPLFVVLMNMITECADGPCRSYPIRKVGGVFVGICVSAFVSSYLICAS